MTIVQNLLLGGRSEKSDKVSVPTSRFCFSTAMDRESQGVIGGIPSEISEIVTVPASTAAARNKKERTEKTSSISTITY